MSWRLGSVVFEDGEARDLGDERPEWTPDEGDQA